MYSFAEFPFRNLLSLFICGFIFFGSAEAQEAFEVTYKSPGDTVFSTKLEKNKNRVQFQGICRRVFIPFIF